MPTDDLRVIMRRKLFLFTLVGVSFCVGIAVSPVMALLKSSSNARQAKVSVLEIMPEADRWGEWGCLYGCLRQDADIACGTFEEIKNVLKEKEDRTGNCVLGHTEAFAKGNLLLVLSWYGNPEGNVYDVQVRIYKRDTESSWMVGHADLMLRMRAVEKLFGLVSEERYFKLFDQRVGLVNSCRVYYNADGVWILSGNVDQKCSLIRFDVHVY